MSTNTLKFKITFNLGLKQSRISRQGYPTKPKQNIYFTIIGHLMMIQSWPGLSLQPDKLNNLFFDSGLWKGSVQPPAITFPIVNTPTLSRKNVERDKISLFFIIE